MMRTTSVVCFVSFVIGCCYCQGSCIIESAGGLKTDLSGVAAATWSGPDRPGGKEEFSWSLSLCRPVTGICHNPLYKAYLQQGPNCTARAGGYFQTYNSAVGGQGGDIFLTYRGNPTARPPIMGREGHVVIKCDLAGSYTNITNCHVDMEPAGINYVYTIQCQSKIACVGAPGPKPPTPPPPPPPPASDCIISNQNGAKTNLAVVRDHTWVGPDQPGGSINYTWSFSPCQQVMGICKQSKYKAYLQQGPDCQQNAYFQNLTAANGGQGGRIYLTYTGNAILHPPLARAGHVIIVCDPKGEYSKLSDCAVDVERAGNSFVYTVQCYGKIACAGAPSPPPAKCGCEFALWGDSKQCMGAKGIEGATGGTQCTHFTDAAGSQYSVAVAAGCRDYNLYEGPDCVNGFMGTFPANHCNATKSGSSAVLFCPPQ